MNIAGWPGEPQPQVPQPTFKGCLVGCLSVFVSACFAIGLLIFAAMMLGTVGAAAVWAYRTMGGWLP